MFFTQQTGDNNNQQSPEKRGDPFVNAGYSCPGPKLSILGNPVTKIEYNLPEAMYVKMQIFNTIGILVRTLMDAETPAGSQTITWDGMDAKGVIVGSGTYICRMTVGQSVRILWMQLVR